MNSPTVEQSDKSGLSPDPGQNGASPIVGLSTSEDTPKIAYVVDDNPQLRHSLSFLMATKNISVHSFESGNAFFDAVDRLSAAPIILDMRMPQMSGIEFQEELDRRGITWPVIVLTGHGEVGVAVRAIKLGAIDFLEKPVPSPELEKCLEHAFLVLESERASGESRLTSRRLLSRLTPRESEVLTALSSGQSNKQVAFALSISPRTVEMHRAKALRQLRIRSIAELVALLNEARNR